MSMVDTSFILDMANL